METRRFRTIDEIGQAAWDRLGPADFPFASYAYLRALEASGAVGESSGWKPLYLAVQHEGRFVGVSYLYEKTNSYGEYIFDWSWAEAYHRHGVPYFPKVTSAVPFTPASGPKLLVEPGPLAAEISHLLIRDALAFTAEVGASSLHYLFLTPDEAKFFASEELILRHSFQYHWRNQRYTDFAAFLAALRPKKARQIRRERAQLSESAVSVRLLTGENLFPEHADVFYRFYLTTIDKMGAIPYLNQTFFRTVFRTMRDKVMLLLAEDGDGPIAGALFYRQGKNLYGRYWGAVKEVRNLHFELCYYRAIEWAIAEGIELFEAGAQGEHKVARGFLPALTYSAHAVSHPAFRKAIADFVEEERVGIAHLFAEMAENSPYA